MSGVFKNKEHSLRSGWKIGAVLISYFVLNMIYSIIFTRIFTLISIKNGERSISSIQQKMVHFFDKTFSGMIFSSGVDFLILVLILLIFLRFIDKKKLRDVGLTSIKSHVGELSYGLLLGALSMSGIFVTLLLTKNIRLINSFSKPAISSYIFTGMFLFILVGIKEELLCRGYCITMLNSMKKPWLSVIVSSLIFSALHLFNPNVKALGLINIVLVGILFGYMFIKTDNLWMPIGYHITWNYFQGNVFGFPVSGTTAHGIYNLSVRNDNLLTGGAFGPEAGLLATIAIIIGMILVSMYETKHN